MGSDPKQSVLNQLQQSHAHARTAIYFCRDLDASALAGNQFANGLSPKFLNQISRLSACNALCP